jgi:hypothetical protein
MAALDLAMDAREVGVGFGRVGDGGQHGRPVRCLPQISARRQARVQVVRQRPPVSGIAWWSSILAQASRTSLSGVGGLAVCRGNFQAEPLDPAASAPAPRDLAALPVRPHRRLERTLRRPGGPRPCPRTRSFGRRSRANGRDGWRARPRLGVRGRARIPSGERVASRFPGPTRLPVRHLRLAHVERHWIVPDHAPRSTHPLG